jgi:hypothetical protein
MTMITFNDLPYYAVNREERHFGFLFLSALVMNERYRADLIAYINHVAGSNLDHRQIDAYAEVSLFRDYWNNLGDSVAYGPATHARRRAIIEAMLHGMGVDLAAIDIDPVFWTGAPGSKLFYPGKWTPERIQTAEQRLGRTDQPLWRLRWLCNAKPDILIEDPQGMVFIEVKVESGFGRGAKGYDQDKTQKEIISIGRLVIPAMMRKPPKLTSLTLNGNGLRWSEVIRILAGSTTTNGSTMLLRHLQSMSSLSACTDTTTAALTQSHHPEAESP